VVALEGIGKQDLAQIKKENPVLLILLASNQSEAVEVADVVLPTAVFAEQEGTFTNFQNRIQKFEKAINPKGQVRPAYEWIGEIAKRMNLERGENSPEAIFQEEFGMKYEELGKEGKVLK
jgi:predicted molibdopterin-dependent oxidoreductase YjgC